MKKLCILYRNCQRYCFQGSAKSVSSSIKAKEDDDGPAAQQALLTFYGLSEASMQHEEIHIFIASFSLGKKNLHFVIGFLSLSTRNCNYLTRLYYLAAPK